MISGIITTILLLLFIGGWVWAWSPKRKADFDEASKLPLEEGKENYPCLLDGRGTSLFWC